MMRAGGDIAVVSDQTRLSRSQVLAAVDLAKAWEAVWLKSSGATSVPAVAVEPESVIPQEGAVVDGTDDPAAAVEVPGPAAASEPEPVSPVLWTDLTADALPFETVRGRVYEDDDPAAETTESADAAAEEPAPDDDSPGVEDYTALLERAMRSHSPRAHDLARSVYHTFDEITALLEREAQVEPLCEEIERLKAELAEKESALAAIYDAGSTLVPEPSPKHAGGTGIDPSLFFAREVREWAREQKLDVRPQGRIANTIVEAYVAAHPEPATV